MISASGVSGEESGRGLPYQALKEWQMPLRLQIGWYRGVFRPRGFLGLENFFYAFPSGVAKRPNDSEWN